MEEKKESKEKDKPCKERVEADARMRTMNVYNYCMSAKQVGKRI